MSDLRADVESWCESLGVTCKDGSDGTLWLDAEDRHSIELVLPDDDHPVRLEDCVSFAAITALRPERLAEVVDDVALSRPGLVDARPSTDGDGIDVVVLVYEEGLNRHTFAEAVYELQKVGHLLRRQIEAAVAAEETLAALEELARNR